jgi:hypothetical protein
MDRPIPEEHEGLLKSALKLEENNELPKEVVELYWDTTRTARRIGQAVSGDLLVTICLLANRATPADPKSFLDRDAKSTRSGKVIVQLDDDTAEDREFGPTLVRRPSRAERKLIGE